MRRAARERRYLEHQLAAHRRRRQAAKHGIHRRIEIAFGEKPIGGKAQPGGTKERVTVNRHADERRGKGGDARCIMERIDLGNQLFCCRPQVVVTSE